MRITITLSLLLTPLVLSCNGTSRHAPELATPPQSSHGLQKAKLRDLMDQLGESRGKIWPQEITAARRSDDDEMFEQIRIAAAALTESAQEIPKMADHMNMHEVDRRSFTAQALTLHDQALRLENAATAKDLARMKRELNAIDTTCNSCHRRFREFAGPLIL